MRLPFFYGWVVVAVAFVTMGIGVTARTAFSLLFPPILAEFGWERGLTAGAFSVGFLVSTLFSPLMGRLMDRYGTHAVLIPGALMVGAGMGLAPLVQHAWQLYLTLGVLVSGGSLCLAYTGHALFLPNWFVRRRGFAIGIAFSGAGVGAIVLLPWMQRLIERYGWRAACASMAILVLVVLVPLNLLQRRRPEDLGLRPDGDPVPAPGAPSHAANVVDPAWAAVDWTLARALRTARFWWIAVAYVTGLFSWYAVQVHQTKYLIDIGFAPAVAAWALGLVPFAGVAGQIALGQLSDRIGRESVWALASGGFALCYVLLLVMREHPSPALLYLMVASQGVLGYGLASIYAAIPAEIFQGRHYATIFGALSVASGAGAGLGPWVAGALYDATGN
ncbi:MAG: MFS transporter, partial [Candidatus Rokubacteria bacterium]|nr:MFS transporter [Candidatus Rokubacteria bacterium]